MRWRIRSQLLLPLLLLLAGVVGISVTTAIASVRQARRQIEVRLRTAALFLRGGPASPLTPAVLRRLPPLPGADSVLAPEEGPIRPPLDPRPESLRGGPTVGDDGHALRLGPPL